MPQFIWLYSGGRHCLPTWPGSREGWLLCRMHTGVERSRIIQTTVGGPSPPESAGDKTPGQWWVASMPPSLHHVEAESAHPGQGHHDACACDDVSCDLTTVVVHDVKAWSRKLREDALAVQGRAFREVEGLEVRADTSKTYLLSRTLLLLFLL
jgi:hypothetical protein